ncbi:hypothetical protein GGD50_006537 [Rhizobium paranaense]|uniref:Uncharacterized protein n=1 Tax=Rhizobium paranaense TaxID=1650438 RepID=A0A7W9D5E3_9HYPH|nr:hypothetical protein [Rhizobium paranaense]
MSAALRRCQMNEKLKDTSDLPPLFNSMSELNAFGRVVIVIRNWLANTNSW